ncbi:MAG: hypothetical protein IPL83_04005 [Bdellovibrionales bacterium]|nr:hypothetical protein [Bdellovibrionales bacterium]
MVGKIKGAEPYLELDEGEPILLKDFDILKGAKSRVSGFGLFIPFSSITEQMKDKILLVNDLASVLINFDRKYRKFLC